MIERHCPRCDSEVELDGGRIVAVIVNGKRYSEERVCKPTEPQQCLAGTDCPAWLCSECGRLFELGANYCSNCGAKVRW